MHDPLSSERAVKTLRFRRCTSSWQTPTTTDKVLPPVMCWAKCGGGAARVFKVITANQTNDLIRLSSPRSAERPCCIRHRLREVLAKVLQPLTGNTHDLAQERANFFTGGVATTYVSYKPHSLELFIEIIEITLRESHGYHIHCISQEASATILENWNSTNISFGVERGE